MMECDGTSGNTQYREPSRRAAMTLLAYISKMRYKDSVAWRVEILNETVAAEITALPADMQARFLRLAERIASIGLENLGEPHVKHLEGKLWELRLRAATELLGRFMSRRLVDGWSWFVRS